MYSRCKHLPMEIKNFFIEYYNNNEIELAEIKPCCQTDNLYYYDVYVKNAYQFTITPSTDKSDNLSWKIALKNSDKNVEPVLVEMIGEQIEKHFFDTSHF